jgi:hypothetical protein
MDYQPDNQEATREQAKRIILGIIAEAGGQFIGACRLNKAFWLAHVLHWEHQEGVLSEHPIVKLRDGPAIDRRESLLKELASEGKIDISRYGVRGQRYTLKGGAPALTAAERESIGTALKRLGGRGYKTVSDFSHDRSISWKDAAIGRPMDYMLDAMDPVEVARIRQSFKDFRGAIDLALQGG